MKYILLVTDNAENTSILSSMLLNKGYRMIVKPDVASALALIREGVDLDAAIVEFGMTDAIDFLAELKHTTTDHLPVIFLSDRVDIQDYLNTLSLGAFDFLFSPIDPREFLRIINIAIERRVENCGSAGHGQESSQKFFSSCCL